MLYRTIVADPPWPIGDFPKWGGEDGRTDCPYPTMSVDEIAALNVKGITNNRDADAHLYLWATTKFLWSARAVAEAWGFDVSSVLVWCKTPRGAGLGGVFVSNVEFIVYARRSGYVGTREPRQDIARITRRIGEIASAAGFTHSRLNQIVGTTSIASWWTSGNPHWCVIPKPEHWKTLRAHIPTLSELDDEVAALNAKKGQDRKPPRPLPARLDTQWFTWPRGKHSQKPEHFYDMVEQVSPAPYVELFARRHRLGWDVWGDESANTASLTG